MEKICEEIQGLDWNIISPDRFAKLQLGRLEFQVYRQVDIYSDYIILKVFDFLPVPRIGIDGLWTRHELGSWSSINTTPAQKLAIENLYNMVMTYGKCDSVDYIVYRIHQEKSDV